MAALKLHEGRDVRSGRVRRLPGGPKRPRHQVVASLHPHRRRLPSTQTNKVLKRVLAREGWECTDPVWVRHGRGADYELLTDEGRAELRKAFAGNGREHLLAAPVAP